MTEPLYVRLRPSSLDDVVGQKKVVKLIKTFLEKEYIPSMIFYGPSGTGKTTLARIIAEQSNAKIYHFSGVKDSVTAIKKYLSQDENTLFSHQKKMVFVDELHRFNKAQQDIFLPIIEDDGVVFIGATTENPSFYVNNALLSRARAVRFDALTVDDILITLRRAVKLLDNSCSDELLEKIAASSYGDVRVALSTLESASYIAEDGLIDEADVAHFSQSTPGYDKKDDFHYRTTSAFIKSLRGSDADAALYYLIKMVDSGDDPLFILRRLLIFASEDVSNGDPHALMLASSAIQAFERVGMPEGKIILSHLVTYLAYAPKSNASYNALHAAEEFFEKYPELPIPSHLINDTLLAPNEQKESYKYPHNYPEHWVEQRYFPGDGKVPEFYKPTTVGYEGKMRDFHNKLIKKK
ncbi:replication-associated recombination protein A [bacterium]|nr:replication-associated recombination protein A [bacterium]